ncbi:MAG: AAA family ATPase [Candidatus Sumerlaeota bacterium]|nr:AAA family ATPase [Candidatus Sumerlaeota bacterium]
MIKIKHIQITDFRSIVNTLDLDLVWPGPQKKALNTLVLAGPNGYGKTSVMEACIRALRQDRLLPGHRKPSADIRKGAKDYSISLTLSVSGSDVEVHATSETTHIPNGVAAIISDAIIEYHTSWRTPEFMGSVELAAGKKGKRPADTERNRLWRLKKYLVDTTADKAFEEGEEAEKLRQQEHEAFRQVRDIWAMFYPGKNETFVAKKDEQTAPGERRYDIYLKGRAEGLIPLDDLSSGEIEILAMLGRYALGLKPSILFIDEPELHLHSAWHTVMLRVIRKILPDSQVICATHSAEILDSVYSYERLTLLPSDDPRIRLTGSPQDNDGGER